MKNKKLPKRTWKTSWVVLFYKKYMKYLVNVAKFILCPFKFIDILRKNVIIIYNFVCIREIL